MKFNQVVAPPKNGILAQKVCYSSKKVHEVKMMHFPQTGGS